MRRGALGLAVVVWIGAACAIPVVLAAVSLTVPGLDPRAARAGAPSLAALSRLLLSPDQQAAAFRASLVPGFGFASASAVLSVLAAFAFLLWGASRRPVLGTRAAYTLVTFALLPPSYLVLALLALQSLSGESVPPSVVIVVGEVLGVLPLTVWVLFVTAAGPSRARLQSVALDGSTVLQGASRLAWAARGHLAMAFSLAWTLSWGNFIVPFSLGGAAEFTPVVQVAAFTTNTGRDWAMIAAASVAALLPLLIIAAAVGMALVRSRGSRNER